MPTFKNITVTISPTTPHQSLPSPLPEYGTLKQSRKSTITTYIPSTANVNFAISIIITPQYLTLTHSNNESLAAYVYFDGRTKEETATLLRRGQETWISSRWVQMPDGSLAEKEFVFKEVGLEVQLGSLGIDTKGASEAQSKKRAKRGSLKNSGSEHYGRGSGGEDEDTVKNNNGSDASDGGLTVNPRRHSMPVNTSMTDEEIDEEEEKQTAGQIRVDLFRVLAEGPVKKGEYHAMFKEGDEDETESMGLKPENGWSGLEYTAGFSAAKPLDSESISTQSVSHIDQPNAPYATFIFFYRGERQLHRMGIIPKATRVPVPAPLARGRSKTFLEELSGKEYTGKGKGLGWDDFRERGDRMVDDEDDADKEDDDGLLRRNGKRELVDDEPTAGSSAVNGKEGEELSEGVRKIRLKRTFSDDPDEVRKSGSAAPVTPAKSSNGTSSSAPNPFSPFSGSSKYSAPNAYRRNGAASPGLSSPLSATKSYSNGVWEGLGSPTKFLGADALKSGLGFGGMVGSSTIGGISSGVRGDATSDTSSGSDDDDKFTAKKRRWSKQPGEEEIL
ncbi:hypothetical protein BDZ91DRAFT_796743 [Kalaharituber pfeilii]|nr:hypothetical protein BDZ91DRAFT_796743 [Kalaharituber pfeilii]